MSGQWFSAPLQFPGRAPSQGEMKYGEGLSQLKLGKCLEAVASLTQAAKLLNNHPAVWAQLGAAHVGTDQSIKARACFERSLSISPDQPFVLNNLGVLKLHAGEWEGALHTFQRALALRPDLMAARQNAALVLFALGREKEAETLLPYSPERYVIRGQALRDKGDLEGAMEAFRAAIRLSIEGGTPTLGTSRPAFTRDGARQALWAAKLRLDRAGIAFCLLAGTLLGVVREGDLLPHDKDLDLGVAWEVERPRVVETLCADGEFTVPWIQGILPPDRPWYRSFCHANSGCILDIFFLRPEGDWILCGSDNRPVPVLCRLKAFGFRDWDWMGETWKVPDPPEQYLTEIYGPEWRVPDPHYDTILSNPARTPESVPGVVCWAYFRLHEALKEGRWNRAKALIAQILARRQDPFLIGLQPQIDDYAHRGSK